jgi:hypothetical protein
VDLEEDLGFFDFVEDLEPDLVDGEGDGRLWNPGQGFWQEGFDAIKVETTVAKLILNVVLGS